MTTPTYTSTRVMWLESGPADGRQKITGDVEDSLRAFCELCSEADCVRASGDFTGVVEYPDCLVARIVANRRRNGN